jgi:serine/threonine-protein kinase ATR
VCVCSVQHSGLFDTLWSLLTLLRSGDRDIFCQIFTGAMMLVEDLVSVASFYAAPTSFTVCTSVSLQCYLGAYSAIQNGSEAGGSGYLPPLCKIPSCWTPPQGPGLLIEVSGDTRWLPLAEWTLQLLTRCLTEVAIHVEGLLTPSFLTTVGCLLSYGDSQLHMVVFSYCLCSLLYSLNCLRS